jgi:predicted nucleic acid-binding protein
MKKWDLDNGFLLDTNIYTLSLLQAKNGDYIHEKLWQFLCSNNHRFISVFVLLELEVFFNLSKIKGTYSEEQELLQQKIRSLQVLELTDSEQAFYIKFKTELSLQGIRNSTTDHFIASQSISNNLTLITANKKHFEKIELLQAQFYNIDRLKFE